MNKEELEKLEEEYYNRFNTFFPLERLNPMPEEEEIKAIKTCLQTNKPYEKRQEYKKGVLY